MNQRSEYRTLLVIALLLIAVPVHAQRKNGSKKSKAQVAEAAEVIALRNDYITAAKDYKASLERLLPLYEKALSSAEQKFVQSKDLFSQRLIAGRDLDVSSKSVSEAKARVEDVHKQMAEADFQIANLPPLAEVSREYKRVAPTRPPRGRRAIHHHVRRQTAVHRD